jgi:aryl-alcohol dehydrogenase-like predicted oxidoreductase
MKPLEHLLRALLLASGARAMRFKTLGEGVHSLVVSEACLGTMTWGVQNTEVEAHAQLDLALSAGVNFIDTAEMYAVPPSRETFGVTERYIGSWLAADPQRRAQVVLATKVSGLGRDYVTQLRRRDLLEYQSSSSSLPESELESQLEERFGAVPLKAALSRKQIVEALEASLARLQTVVVKKIVEDGGDVIFA